MHDRKTSKLTRWLRFLLLFPVMLFMGVEGDGGGGAVEGEGGGTVLGGASTEGDGGGEGGEAQTPEQIAAAEAAAAGAEKARFDALTPEEQAAETAAKAAAELDKAGAPEEYAEFVMPEGVQADVALLDKFKPLAKEFNLTQVQAQKLVDLQTEAVATVEKSKADAWATITKEWQTAAKTDKEIGGTEYDANCKTALRAINTFGTPELKTMLNQYGIGNHPEMIRLMTRIGKGMAEDKVVIPGAGMSKKSIEDSLYGPKE